MLPNLLAWINQPIDRLPSDLLATGTLKCRIVKKIEDLFIPRIELPDPLPPDIVFKASHDDCKKSCPS